MDDADPDPGTSTRFKPGQTGNRKGRPRKSHKSQSDFSLEELRDRKVTVHVDGAEREMSIPEALLQKTFHQALAGARMPIREILKRILAHLTVTAPTNSHFPRVIYLHPNPQSVDEAMLILGIANTVAEASREDGRPQLLLEPWAAARGIKRAKGPPRSDKDIRELKRRIRNPDSLVWPARDEE